jgi:membrane fusion protein, heavy metal efflux system
MNPPLARSVPSGDERKSRRERSRIVRPRSSRRFSRRRGKLRAGLAIAALLALAGCSREETKMQNKMTSYSGRAAVEAGYFSVPKDQLAHLQIVTVATSAIERVLRLPGTVAYNLFHTTPVITPVGGPVSRILVVPGETVRQGQPLLYVSSPDYSQLRAGYLKARSAFYVADKNYDRAKDLYAHHAIAERDLLQAQADRNQARADLQASEQGLRILGVGPAEVNDSGPTAAIPLRAPIAGEVVERLVAPGQLLQAGATQCFTISDMHTVWVMVNIYQKDLPSVRVGELVSIETDAYPDRFQGHISYLAAALDPNTRTLAARIVTQNPASKLKKDMYVTAIVDAGVIPDALTVPEAAVLRDSENHPFVYSEVGANQFAKRLVTTGEEQKGKIRILSGLKAGERVVGDGSLFLQFANSLQR